MFSIQCIILTCCIAVVLLIWLIELITQLRIVQFRQICISSKYVRLSPGFTHIKLIRYRFRLYILASGKIWHTMYTYFILCMGNDYKRLSSWVEDIYKNAMRRLILHKDTDNLGYTLNRAWTLYVRAHNRSPGSLGPVRDGRGNRPQAFCWEIC